MGTELALTFIPILPIVTVSVVALSELAVGTGSAVWKAVALPVLPNRITPSIMLAGSIIRFKLLPLDIWLWGVWSGGRRPLKSMVLLLVRSRALGRRSEPVRHCSKIVALVELASLTFFRRSLLTALRHRLSSLGRSDQSVIMLGVLQVVLGGDRIASSMGISRELKVFLGDMLRVSSNFHVGTVQFVRSR